MSPYREQGRFAIEFNYWNKHKNVAVKIRIRRFEIGCLLLALLCVTISLFGGRFNYAGADALIRLLQLFAQNSL